MLATTGQGLAVGAGIGRVGAMVLGNCQSRCVLFILIIIRQRPTVLAVGADGVVWLIFLSPVILLFFFLLTRSRLVQPETTNQILNLSAKDSIQIEIISSRTVSNQNSRSQTGG